MGRDEWITIEYSDVRTLGPTDVPFPPALPADVREFRESALPPDEAAATAPFPLPFAALRQSGYEIVEDRVRLVLDSAHSRGYAVLPCAKLDAHGRAEAVAVVRLGNYLSRLMARRRAVAGDRGEPAAIGDLSARYFDHRTAWTSEIPPDEMPFLSDLFWEREGRYWMLSGDGLDKDSLLALASALA